jgi:hypothetical protein
MNFIAIIALRFVFAAEFCGTYVGFSDFQSLGVAIKGDDELFNRL